MSENRYELHINLALISAVWYSQNVFRVCGWVIRTLMFISVDQAIYINMDKKCVLVQMIFSSVDIALPYDSYRELCINIALIFAVGYSRKTLMYLSVDTPSVQSFYCFDCPDVFSFSTITYYN